MEIQLWEVQLLVRVTVCTQKHQNQNSGVFWQVWGLHRASLNGSPSWTLKSAVRGYWSWFSGDKLYLQDQYVCESWKNLKPSSHYFTESEISFLIFSVLHMPAIPTLEIMCFLGWAGWSWASGTEENHLGELTLLLYLLLCSVGVLRLGASCVYYLNGDPSILVSVPISSLWVS